MIQYNVEMTLFFTEVVKDKVRRWARSQIIPAFSKFDAEDIVARLAFTLNGHQDDPRIEVTRSFRVVGTVWTAKGKVHLTLEDIKMIAEEYTTPFRVAAE